MCFPPDDDRSSFSYLQMAVCLGKGSLSLPPLLLQTKHASYQSSSVQLLLTKCSQLGSLRAAFPLSMMGDD